MLEKRIEADTAALGEVRQELATSSRLSSVAPGTSIVARLGRAGSAAVEEVRDEAGNIVTAAKAATAGTLREVQAVVLGIKEEGDSLRYKIEHGEGFDKDVVVIQSSQIISINAADEAAQY